MKGLATAMSRQRSLVLQTLGALLVLLTTSAVLADATEARRHYQKGITAFNLQKFSVALEEFQAAYGEKQDPVFLYNIGQTQRNLGAYEAAAKSYRAFLNQAQALPASQRDDVERLVKQMDDAARDERAKQPPTGTQSPPTLTTATPTTATQPPVIVATPAPPRRPWFKNPVTWTLVGVGVASGAVSAALLSLAASEGNRATHATTMADFDSHHASDVSFQKGGWPLLGIGATSLLVAGIVIAVDAKKQGH